MPAGRQPSEFGGGGWAVLLIASITAALTGPGQTIGVAVFIDFFVDDLGIGRSAVSTAYLVGTLGGAVALPWVGRFIDVAGVRIAQSVIGLAFGLAVVNMAAVNGIIWLTVGFAGIRFLGQGALSLVATVTVAVRFMRQRGTAIGLFAMSTSALMALVPFGLNAMIDGVGWRQAWILAGVIVAATVVPLGWVGLRSLPGRKPSTPSPLTPRIDQHDTVRSADRSEALRTSAFWVLAAVSGVASMLVTALNFHQIDLMGASGISAATAAALFIPQVIGSTVAGLVVGSLADRIGTRLLPAASMLLLTVTMLLAATLEPGVIAFSYAVLLGATGGAARTATASLLPAWFGTDHIGSIQGSMTFLNVAASAIGPVSLAIASGTAGGYPVAVVVLAGLPAIAMLAALRVREPSIDET